LYRIIRSIKNRFGSTNELGIYEMNQYGLKPVENPSDLLISDMNQDLSGVAIGCTMEGNRALLIEIQALVSTAVYGTPQRSTTGYDGRRLNMLLAVLEKKCGFNLAGKDVFLNITGGLKVEDTALDLAVICAILSSNQDINISSRIAFAGEIGLSGEVRPVQRIENRIKEAEKLGFEMILIAESNRKALKNYQAENIKVRFVKRIEEVFGVLFD
jgi:DNA repair protein RadA/Sms